MREKISVIVPVYGVEKMLARCVESILAQTYENIELVLWTMDLRISVRRSATSMQKNIKILW